MQYAKRFSRLETGIFSEINLLAREHARQGGDVINLSVGSPDRGPAPHIIQALSAAVADPALYGYALSEGMDAFKQAVADWYGRRFGVELDPGSEVLSLMGSQDGLGHIFLAFLDPGDLALLPDPGYPIYTAGVIMADGEIYHLPLRQENGYLPDLAAVPPEVAQKARVMVLNYPNNPLTAVADLAFFTRVVEFAREYGIIVIHDVAYSELSFDGYRPVSFLQAPGAKEVGVEFHSLSKTYNMAGCRIAFIVGNRQVVDALRRVKSNIDYGIFLPVQMAGIAALNGPDDYVRETAMIYQNRRDILVEGMNAAGWPVQKPQATMFVWAPLPPGYQDDALFTRQLIENTGIVVTPGQAFGQLGRGYVRLALVSPEERLREAVQRIQAAGICRRSEKD